MGGALLDLVAKGGQDVYLICKPQITFFKKVYKRHTNFAIEYKKFDFESTPDFGKSTKLTIPRNGDLVKSMFLHIELPQITSSTGNTDDIGYINYIGYGMIDYIELYIGNTLIDRYTGEWLYIQSELVINESKKKGYKKLVGGHDFSNTSASKNNLSNPLIFIVPIPFWFSYDMAEAIPYVALQYSDIDVKVKFKDFDNLYIRSNNNITPQGNYKIEKCKLSVEYIYLDTKERKMFAQSNHEYLIKQVQISENNNILPNQTDISIPINFNHPILEIIFVVINKNAYSTGVNNFYNFGKNISYFLEEDDPIVSAKLLLEGQDRTPEMTAKELRYLNIIEKHTSLPNNKIYVYSFSQKPESLQPSGTCNFSRFDSVKLNIKFAENIGASELKIFGVNYNVLRIAGGLGGLAYIN